MRGIAGICELRWLIKNHEFRYATTHAIVYRGGFPKIWLKIDMMCDEELSYKLISYANFKTYMTIPNG